MVLYAPDTPVSGAFSFYVMTSPTVEQSLFSNWFKLLLGVGSIGVGLVVMKLFLAGMGSFFVDPFYSFVVLAAIAIGIYYLVHGLLLMRAKKAQPEGN